jgi:hypothetical protein
VGKRFHLGFLRTFDEKVLLVLILLRRSCVFFSSYHYSSAPALLSYTSPHHSLSPPHPLRLFLLFRPVVGSEIVPGKLNLVFGLHDLGFTSHSILSGSIMPVRVTIQGMAVASPSVYVVKVMALQATKALWNGVRA